MINHTNSPNTAIAIGAAMERACVSGDLEVAERLFESYRLLFAEYQMFRNTTLNLLPFSRALQAQGGQ